MVVFVVKYYINEVIDILHGEDGMRQLEIVCRVLNECGAKVNKSCGTHVHLGAKDLTIEEWRRIYINLVQLGRHIRFADEGEFLEDLIATGFVKKVSEANN